MKLKFEKPQGDEWRAYEATVVAMTAFGRNAAPLTFSWLGWCALMALVRYAEVKTGLWPLTALQWILGVFLWAYFGTFLSAEDKVEWKSRAEITSRAAFLRLMLSLLATGGMVKASYWFADVFMRHPL